MMAAVTLYAAVALWGILCGAVVYEHVAIIPVWASNPPESLKMWSGPYRIAPQRFWIVIHHVIIVMILAALATNWNNVARNPVALTGAGYVLAVLVPTAIWFVPRLLRLIDPDGDTPPDVWRRRSKLWERLSLVRGAIVIALIVPLLVAVEVRA